MAHQHVHRDDLAQQQRPADAERRADGRSAAARASERRVDSRERASRGVSMRRRALVAFDGAVQHLLLKRLIYLQVPTRVQTGRNSQRGEKRGAVADQEPRRLEDAPNVTT